MSRDRTKRERLERLIPDPFGAPDGQVMVTTKIDDQTYIYTLETLPGGGAVDSVTGTAPINVDNTDPDNPVVGHNASGVTPGSYTNTNITVDADGHVTAAANGSSGYVAPQARLATAAALPSNTYLNGASGVGATLTGVATGVLTVDGVTVALNDNVLIKNEATQSHNGLYVCTLAGAIGVAYVLTRSTRMDTSAEFLNALVPVGPEGTANADTLWQSVPVPPVTVGTTAIPFVKDSGTASPLTTKGDLYGHSTVDARVPVGTNNQFLVPDSAQALGLKYTDLRGGLSWRVGRKDGAVLLAGFQRIFILPAGYDSLATWELSVYPGATCAVDIQYRTFGSTQPGTGDSIVGGVYPATTGSVTATGTTASWTNTAPAIGAYIAIYVHANDLAREIIFQVAGRRIP